MRECTIYSIICLHDLSISNIYLSIHVSMVENRVRRSRRGNRRASGPRPRDATFSRLRRLEQSCTWRLLLVFLGTAQLTTRNFEVKLEPTRHFNTTVVRQLLRCCKQLDVHTRQLRQSRSGWSLLQKMPWGSQRHSARARTCLHIPRMCHHQSSHRAVGCLLESSHTNTQNFQVLDLTP